jgi:branched-chain amino acid aminotransferase
MTYQYFSRNGTILPIEEAVVPLGSVEYSYGFGVYETIRVSRGAPYFLEQHAGRLLNSACIITLPHNFSAEFVQTAVRDLVEKTGAETCNLKILLVGGQAAETADLYLLCLNPLFPDRKLYARGAAAITHRYEREFPQAKTLNMLSSYLAYRQARAAGAYDALLVNRQDRVTEGTRTNFFAVKDRTIISPPAADILPGVMREAVLSIARQNGFKTTEQAIELATIPDYDGAFLTSTSSKIMPLRSIDDHMWQTIPNTTRELMAALDQLLDNPPKEHA